MFIRAPRAHVDGIVTNLGWGSCCCSSCYYAKVKLSPRFGLVWELTTEIKYVIILHKGDQFYNSYAANVQNETAHVHCTINDILPLGNI